VLKLDDDAIEFLKNGHFNHRLLCEIIKHPAFEKYMADIEIYVNGITTSQIRTLKETAPASSIIEDIKSDLEAYKNFKGSVAEKDFALMCKRWNINYSKVPDDEKMIVMYFLHRSKNYQKHFL